MGCPPVRGDNPRALASGLSSVQVDKHAKTYRSAEECYVGSAKRCIQRLEENLKNLTQPEKCIEFSKVDGEFWRCKAVLEKCYSEITLLQRLSSLNVQFKDACEEVCIAFEDIKRQCSVEEHYFRNHNFTEFCRSYGASIKCVDYFQQNCQIAKEFFEKTMATPKMPRFYTHLCNKGCSNLDVTLVIMDRCAGQFHLGNCSTLSDYKRCIHNQNQTVCPESKYMLSYFYSPECIIEEDSESIQTTDQTHLLTTALTSKENRFTNVNPTANARKHEESKASSSCSFGAHWPHSTAVGLVVLIYSKGFMYWQS